MLEPPTDKLPPRFTSAGAARRYLESLLWKGGAVCAHCGVTGQTTALKGKSTRPGLRWCNACRKPFSVTVGTIYENSKVPLNIWLYANHLLCGSNGTISTRGLARMLQVSYKTAWYLTRHIRAAISRNSDSAPPGSSTA